MSNPDIRYLVGHRGRLGQVHRLGLVLGHKPEQGHKPELGHRPERVHRLVLGDRTGEQQRQQPQKQTKQ